MTDVHTLEIKDLDHFIGLLSRWHTHKIKLVKHLMEMPETAEVTIEGDSAIQMTGDFRKGFQLGISLALEQLGELPFVAEMEESAEAIKH